MGRENNVFEIPQRAFRFERLALEYVQADSGDLTSSPQEELPPVPTNGPPSSMVSNDSQQPLPYLGISVQRIESHSTPGRVIDGLEIVNIDPNSPAERAGLKGRGWHDQARGKRRYRRSADGAAGYRFDAALNEDRTIGPTQRPDRRN
jgi:hypothetical protein